MNRIVFIFFALQGCVVFPIPPNGENIGKFGKIQFGFSYIPPKPSLDWFKELPELNFNSTKKTQDDDMAWFHPVVPQPNITLK
jgi:hypothetical protein